jgi:ABC-type transporter Mla MlaB component
MNSAQKLSLTVAGDRLRIDGVLDFTTAANMAVSLRECMDALPAAFTVDLSGLVNFNSAALVLMLDCVRLGAQSNKHCQFSGATAALANMLKMASLEELLAGNAPPASA